MGIILLISFATFTSPSSIDIRSLEWVKFPTKDRPAIEPITAPTTAVMIPNVLPISDIKGDPSATNECQSSVWLPSGFFMMLGAASRGLPFVGATMFNPMSPTTVCRGKAGQYRGKKVSISP
jgi:hypothetical protein